MAKDMLWHELFDRLHGNDCPVCNLIHDRIVKSMDGFLYEGVNDSGLRKKICESNGLCNYHAHMLMKMGDPLAHALIYTDLLKEASGKMLAATVKKHSLYQTQNKCFYCEQAQDGESAYILAFINAFQNDAFVEKYNREGLLCLPHLELVRNVRNRSDTRCIVQTTLNKYQSLIDCLSEIIRKHDYRFSDEIWTQQEKAAWKNAIDIINGREGIRN